jgi:glycosyltransferase involved in cell wall biosynthesis
MSKASVCIATYNGAKFIEEQLLSIIKQLREDDEIIISDNCSTDDTINVIEKIGDRRIKIVKLERSNVKRLTYEGKLRFVYLNFRNAILHAAGDYIFLSDQDDIWIDGKYDAVMNEFETERKALIVHDALYKQIDTNINNQSNFKFTRTPSNSFWDTLIYNTYLGCCTAFKKDLALFAFSEERIVIPHDTWIALLACLIYPQRISVINNPFLQYRLHETNTSFIFKSNNTLFFKLKYRFYLLVNAFSMYCKYKIKKINLT